MLEWIYHKFLKLDLFKLMVDETGLDEHKVDETAVKELIAVDQTLHFDFESGSQTRGDWTFS